MFLSMNWISDFVDLSGLDKLELINKFSLSTAEVENDIFFFPASLLPKSNRLSLIPIPKSSIF